MTAALVQALDALVSIGPDCAGAAVAYGLFVALSVPGRPDDQRPSAPRGGEGTRRA